MRLCILLILGFTLSLSARSYAQQERVTFDLKNVSVKTLLDEIRKQTKLCFLFNPQQTDRLGQLSLKVKNETVENILNRIFKDSELTYKFRDDLIVIMSRNEESDNKARKEVKLVGRVTTKDKESLPGVTVAILKDKKSKVAMGTVTDVDGRYVLVLPDDWVGFILRYSFVGMKTEEVKYTGQDSIDIVMEEDVARMEEVVITGYQRIEKRHLTSAVTTLKADDIMVAGMNSIDQMLEGHVPGMIFMQNSGQVGAASRLRIRGTSTVLGNQEPLWVLDGIILTDPVDVDPSQINDLDFVNLLGNAIAGINPSDIEQIDVLKDASATALYGARAANGVIVITTKKGKIGAPSITYSFTGTFSRRPYYKDKGVNVMNSAERIDFSREIVQKGLVYNDISSKVGYESAILDYYNGQIDFETYAKEIQRYEKVNTDWFDALTQNAFSHNHNLSLSGGTENVRYYSSLGYLQEQGVLQKEYLRRYTASLNMTANYNRFQVRFYLSGNVSEKRYTPENVGLLNYAYNTSRAVPMYNEEGKLDYYRKSGGNGTYYFNILNERDNTYDKIWGNSFTLSTTADYRFADWLRFGVTLSYSLDNTNRDTYYGEKTYYAAGLRGDEVEDYNLLPFGGELQKDDTRKNAYTLRGQLDFNKFLDQDSKNQIIASLGGEISSTRYKGLAQTHRCYLPDRGNVFNEVDVTKYTGYANWLARDENARGVLKDELQNLASLYATLSYSYADLYILNVNARIDASNEFGSKANDKLLPIWSFSGRWNIAQDILQGVNWVDDLALRASLGIQGNMIRTVSSQLVVEKGGINTDFDKYQSTVKYFPNPDLKWEKTTSYDVGLDFAFLQGKIQGTVSCYFKQTKNAFLNKTISEINGVSAYVVNKGTLRNQGFDLSLSFNPISTGKGRNAFNWRFDPQIGQVLNQLVNKALNKDKTVKDEVTYQDYLDGNVEVAGRPLNTFYSYKFSGLDPSDGRPMFYNANEFEGEDENRVSVKKKYSAMTKDEVFLTVMEHSGTRVPTIQGGFMNTFSYHGFVLALNFTYSVGAKVRLLKLYSHMGTSGTLAPQPVDNVRREFLHRWQRPGDELHTNIPGLISDSEYRQTIDSPWWQQEPYKFAENIWQMYDDSNIRVVSGNYLKLQSLSFRYVIPERICKYLSLQAAYVSFTGSNLFTVCSKKLNGQEPTQSGSSDNINLSVRPNYSLNLNISF